ncbi:dihydrofolate reductase family protein [Flavisphingomonas formosensis]|uniref:dihydrofolate reductase family protein n=1 Tax=Flavisphingomonas formosensis TaxID=861534 RepID=UPI0018E013BE
MRRLVLQMQMSADGFVGSLDGSPWQLWDWGENNGWDEELRASFNAHFERLDAILLNRKTLEEGYLDHWEKAASRYPVEPFYAFARRITDADKFVSSDRLQHVTWPRTTVVSGELEREVCALKSRPG